MLHRDAKLRRLIMSKFIWQNKPWQAVWGCALFFSLFLNMLFLVLFILAICAIVPLFNGILEPLIVDLSRSFDEMNQASIAYPVQVDQAETHVAFDLLVSESTTVTLAAAVPLNVDAQFVMPYGVGVINGRVALVLPQGTQLPIDLNLLIPVNQAITTSLEVPVNIPLADTALGDPFARLQQSFGPLAHLFQALPSTNGEAFQRIKAAVRSDGREEAGP
jgi:hypothetical protein